AGARPVPPAPGAPVPPAGARPVPPAPGAPVPPAAAPHLTSTMKKTPAGPSVPEETAGFFSRGGDLDL
ncbi:MAG: hypothetical protein IKW04_03715, partial [Clostridia bacterium]|nr:hypothetical protein [Clostridia bacterium]